jgi:hypothetical protein
MNPLLLLLILEIATILGLSSPPQPTGTAASLQCWGPTMSPLNITETDTLSFWVNYKVSMLGPVILLPVILCLAELVALLFWCFWRF